MDEEYKIDKTDSGYELKRVYIKQDNTQGLISVAQFTSMIEFNNFLEKETEKRLNEFFKEHNIKHNL